MKKILALLLLTLILSATPVYAADSAAVWAIGDCHKIDPATGKDYNPSVPKDISGRNYIWDGRANTASLFGA